MTWEELVKIEPRLLELYHAAKYAGTGQERFCGNEAWYGVGDEVGFKHLMSQLAGWETPKTANPRVRTSEAYEVALDKIYNALPPCRHCGDDEAYWQSKADDQ